MSSLDHLHLRCDGKAGIPFPRKQGNGPSSQDEEGKMGLFLRVAGPSVFLSSRHGYVRELLELYQGPFQCSRRNVEFLSRCCCGKRPHLALRGESPGFSQVAAGSLAFLSSYYGDLSDPLVFPQESQVSMRVARGLLDSSPVAPGF